ncbi:MAG: D-alanyl-D-alanine carboxypeptidase, partial [Candidatus Dadabacteria bacterium]|nr:D-alanyl-D-alanine carboxypeptidase [Candidatus Dadabacteria bacterium]
MSVFTQGSQTIVRFKGEYPKSCGEQDLLRAVLPNDQYIFGVFKSLWQEMGGTISGTVGKTKAGNNQPFYIVPSRQLSEIITNINKHSNNVMARQLLLTIGQKMTGETGSKAAGRQAIKDWLGEIGINAPELILENGSG